VVGVALGVSHDEFRDKTLFLKFVDFFLDGPLRLLHPGRHRIDIGPADRERRLAVALHAFGRGGGFARHADAGE
jgi:hypothetical protein